MLCDRSARFGRRSAMCRMRDVEAFRHDAAVEGFIAMGGNSETTAVMKEGWAVQVVVVWQHRSIKIQGREADDDVLIYTYNGTTSSHVC